MPVPLGQFETTASGGDILEADRRLSGDNLATSERNMTPSSAGSPSTPNMDYTNVCIGASHARPAERRRTSSSSELQGLLSSSGGCYGPGIEEARRSSPGSQSLSPRNLLSQKSPQQPKLEPGPVPTSASTSPLAACAPRSAAPMSSSPGPSPGQHTPKTPLEMLHTSDPSVGLRRGSSAAQPSSLEGGGAGSTSNVGAAAILPRGAEAVCNQDRLVALGNEVEALGLVPKGGAQACIAQEAQVFQVAKAGGLQVPHAPN